MFKSASIFKITLPPLPFPTIEIEFAAGAATFIPCGPTQDRSVGWVPPRGQEHGAMVESIAGHLIMRLMIETKTVPAHTIKDALAEQVASIERETGRKPGKKEKREIADDVRRALLPIAFPKRAAVWVWIDPAAGLLVIDSSSQSRTDEVITQLVRTVDGITVKLVDSNVSPSALMTGWLMGGDDADHEQSFSGMSIGRACELRASDESKAIVRYTRHGLDTEEVKQHIAQGMAATKLALTHLDRVDFVLTDAGTLTSINVLDVVFEQHANKADQAADNFDADVAIITGELKPLIENLFLALDVQDREVQS